MGRSKLGPSKTSKTRIEVAERQAKALKMRVAGVPVPEIAEAVGVGTSTVYGYIQRAIERLTEEPAKEVIALELMRLDILQAGAWPEAIRGNTKKMHAVLQVMHHRAKLLGLYAVAAPDMSGDAVTMLIDFMKAVREGASDPEEM